MKKKQVKENGIQKKIKRIERSLDRIERGSWSEFSIEDCADYIGWLAKFNKVPESVWSPLCDRIIQIFEDQGYLKKEIT